MSVGDFVTYPRPKRAVTATDEQMEAALAVRTCGARALLADPVLLAALAAVYPFVPKLEGGVSDGMALYACATTLVLIASRSIGVWCTVQAMDIVTRGRPVWRSVSSVLACLYVILPVVGSVIPLGLTLWAVGFLARHGGRAWAAERAETRS